MSLGLYRRKAERGSDYLERVWADPLFEDATPQEVARFVGCAPGQAAKARHGIMARQGHRLHMAHAEAVAEQVGWPLGASALITLALERYAEKMKGRSLASTKSEGPSGTKGPGVGRDPEG